jgi:hypothetical protein
MYKKNIFKKESPLLQNQKIEKEKKTPSWRKNYGLGFREK